MGIKIVAQGLEQAVAGTSLLVQEPEDDLDELKEEVLSDMKNVMGRIDKTGEGVRAGEHARVARGSVRVFKIRRGEDSRQGHRHRTGEQARRHGRERHARAEATEFATILAFDVPVTAEATKMAKELDVRIMTADIIYHLFDQFTATWPRSSRRRRTPPPSSCRSRAS